MSASAYAATFVVNDAGDAADANIGNGLCSTSGGVCTLRAAIQEANAAVGSDDISFSIGSGPQTIAPASDLPAITNPVTINGTTQPGSGTAPRILLDGANARTAGIDVNNASVTVIGLAIVRFTIAGIRTLQNGDIVQVQRCYIGVGLDGLTAMGNGDGIWAKTSDLGGSQLLVGDALGGGNVISGNLDMGIELNDNGGAGAKLHDFSLQGNIIGLGADGTTPVGNQSGGIRTNLQFNNIIVGGSVAGRNIISGNGGGGYITQAFFQADTFVASYNYVGVAADGVTPRGNNGTGLNLVGRVYTVEQNIVAANGTDGIVTATGNGPSVIRANRVGVALDGTPLGNLRFGISVTSGNGMVIGGPGADQNIIAFNTSAGVRITGTAQAEVAENSIHDNGGLGIDLGTLAVADPNDALDADTQNGNNLQNRPQLVSAATGGGITAIIGSLASASSASYTIRFYMSPAADPSGFGEGATSIGSQSVTTNGSGTASFTFNTPSAPAGAFVTATASAANGDTSEFSNSLLVASPGQLRFAASGISTPESGTATLTVERVGGTTGAVSVHWATDPGSAVPPADYADSSGTLFFADGQTTQTLSVPIASDTLDEFNESFNVVLSNPTGGASLGSPAIATVIINDDDPTPALSIAGESHNEGNSGNSPMTFLVSLNASSGQSVTVNYITNNGTAIAGSDFAAVTGTLTFAPGETTKPIAVPILGDTDVETDETLSVTLSSPTNATLAAATASGTIVNDDGVPSLSIGDVAIVEGDSGSTTAFFPLTLSGPTTQQVVVSWSTADASATAGSDYQALSGVTFIAAGTTSTTVEIPIFGDALPEDNETFLVNLSGPSFATLGDAEATGTIADDDGTPSLSINDPAVVEGTPAVFTVTLAPASSLSVSVSYTSTDPTNASGLLTFAPGETTKTISIPTTNDSVAEPAETFVVTLSSPTGASIGDDTGTGTVIDDDGPPRVTIGNASASEGGTLTFTVDLSHGSASNIDVSWQTVDGTAADASDYTGLSGTLTFLPGELSKTIVIASTTDSVVEPDETFFLHLASASNATITDSDGAGTILNDDGVVSVSIQDATAAESGTLTFDVTLSAAASQTVSVQFATADGTAASTTDYAAAAGSLTFAAGETLKQIAIDATNDSSFEGTEAFFVNLIAASNATIADDQATGTILDDDSAPVVPSISIAPASTPEGNGGASSLAFNVTLNAATTNTVSVAYSTSDLTASAGADYVATNGTLTFAPGATLRTIHVPVLGDTLVEGNETFDVTLSLPTNATLGATTATGTIVDDDTAAVIPSISISSASLGEGNAGTAPLTFAVMLSAATTNIVTVNYSTGGGNATAGSDYAATSGALTFGPGVTQQTIVVPIVGDTLVETNETFDVTLSSPSSATLGGFSATGTILDDDSLPFVPAVAISDVSLAEGDEGATLYDFLVTLSGPAANTATVQWTTLDGSARAGSDFIASGGTLVFAPGMTSQTIPIAVNGDTRVESNETFTVQLSTPVNATIAVGSATGTIRNDDRNPPPIPALSASAPAVHEGDDATVTLTLSSPAPGASVRWLTHPGTASSTDFTEASGRLTFGSGTTATIEIATTQDAIDDDDEVLTVEFYDPQGLTLRDERVTITITDDDEPRPARGIVLVAGSLNGDAGSRFGTAVQLVNATGTPATGTILIHPANTAGTARDAEVPYALGPGELRAFGDLLAAQGLQGLATLDVLPSTGALPHLTVRIYDDGSGHGTTGFSLPVVTPDAALAAGDGGVLVAPDNLQAMRFNVGIRTLESGAELTIEVRDRLGALRKITTRDFSANWFNQFSGSDFAGLALNGGDYLVIRITGGSAILYGASIDNITNDPSVEVLTR